MAEKTSIEWTDHTFNPWWGCAKVSPGCDHCYAERDAGRYQPERILWGVNAERRTFGDAHWLEPVKWNRQAMKAPVNTPPPRVFCASMADVFDKNAPEGQRDRLWQLIRATRFLDWQLLTKRVGNVRAMLPPDWGKGWPNVWLGISVVNQAEADRDIPKLLALPARVRFLSCEPLLDSIDLARWLVPQCSAGSIDVPGGGAMCPYCQGERHGGGCQPLHWVIAGGESGPRARPMNPHWIELIRDTCAKTSTPFLFKQWGEYAPSFGDADVIFPASLSSRYTGAMKRVGKKNAGRELGGRTWTQFPGDVRL